jgi:hypothetical protein
MPFVVRCGACGKRLNIPDKSYEGKIRGRVVKIGCKACGAEVKVDGTRPREEVDLSRQQSQPEGAPEPTAKSDTARAAESEARPGTAPAAESASQPVAKPPEAKLAPKRELEANSAPEPEPAEKSSPEHVVPKPQAEATPAPKPELKTAAEPEAEAKTALKPELKSSPVATARPGGPELKGAPRRAGGLPGLGLPKPGSARFGLPKPGAGAGSLQQKPSGAGARDKVTSKSPPKPPSRPRTTDAGQPPKSQKPATDPRKRTFPGTPSAKGLTPLQPLPPGFKPKDPEPAALRPFDESDSDQPTAGIPPEEGKPKERSPGFSKRTSPGTPDAMSVLQSDDEGSRAAESDPGVSDWLWAVSFDDDEDREMTLKEVIAALESGEIDADTIVWREGMGDWKPIREVEEFAAALGTASDEPREEAGVDASAPVEGGALRDAIEDDDLDPPADSREAWRRSTADLLAELSVGKENQSGAEPVAPHPVPGAESVAAGSSDKPRAATPSLRPSLIPQKGPARIFVFVLVGLVVVLAIVGVVVLAVYGLAEDDDPTLSAPVPTGVPAQAEAASKPAGGSEQAQSNRPKSGVAASGSAGDLASAVSAGLGPGEEEASGPKFDRKKATEKLTDAARRASACRPKNSDDQKGPAKVQVTFDPLTGGVTQVRVLGRYSGTKTGTCIELTMKAIHLKKFSGPPVTIEQSVMVR